MRMFNRIVIYLIVYSGIFLFPWIAVAQKEFRLDDHITSDPELVKESLPNGFNYYLRRDTSMSDEIFIGLVVKVGFEQEDRHELEMAHVLEHLAFRSTVTQPDLKKYFDSRGLAFGTHYTGGADFNKTAYSIHIRSDAKYLLRDCLRIMREWAQDGIFFDSVSVNSERGVVLQELEMGESPEKWISTRFVYNVIGPHNQSGRLLLDSRDNVRRFEYHALREFYKRWYSADREAVIVIGDINVDTVRRQIANLFSDIQNRASVVNKSNIKALLKGTDDVIELTHDGIQKTQCKIVIKEHYEPVLKYGDIRKRIVSRLMTDILQARHEMVDPDRGRYRFEPIYANHGRPFSAFCIDIEDTLGGVRRLFSDMMGDVFRLKRTGFSVAELDDAKLKYIDRHYPGHGVYRMFYDYIDNFERGAIAISPEYEFFVINRLLESISVDDINRRIRALNVNRDRTVGIFLSTSDGHRFSADKLVRSWFREAVKKGNSDVNRIANKKTIISPLWSKEKDSALEKMKGAKIDSMTIDSLGIKKLQLENNFTILLKPMANHEPKFYFKVVKRGGVDDECAKDSLTTFYSEDVVSGSGLGDYDSQNWSQYLSEKGITFMQSILKDEVSMFGSARSSSLEDVLQIINRFFMDPKMDTALFRSWQERMKKSIKEEKMRKLPEDRYQNALSLELRGFGGVTAELGDLENVTMAKMYDRYRQIFSNDGSLLFVICGAFDTNSAIPLINRYLGSIPQNRNDLAKVGNVNQDANRCDESGYRTFFGTSDHVSQINIAFSMCVFDSLNDQVKIDLAKDEFQSSMLYRLRHKEGISYSPVVYVTRDAAGAKSRYTLGVSFDCKVGKEDEAIGYVRDEMRKLSTFDRQREFLSSSKLAVSKRLKADVLQPFFWVQYLCDTYIRQLSADRVLGYERSLNDISEVDMIRFVSKFNPVERFIFKLVPSEPRQ